MISNYTHNMFNISVVDEESELTTYWNGLPSHLNINCNLYFSIIVFKDGLVRSAVFVWMA